MAKYTIGLLALLLAGPAAAQIAPLSPAQQRAANRQALREAHLTTSPYKESHLTVTPQQLKRGSTEGPPGAANEARQRSAASPRSGLKLLHLRRSKTEPAS